jgi:hypothetical protein
MTYRHPNYLGDLLIRQKADIFRFKSNVRATAWLVLKPRQFAAGGVSLI